jgi:hypothetical protein
MEKPPLGPPFSWHSGDGSKLVTQTGSVTRRTLQTFQLIFDTQFAPFQVGDLLIVRGGRRKNTLKLILKNLVFLLKRCNMSLYGHVAYPSFKYLPPAIQSVGGLRFAKEV